MNQHVLTFTNQGTGNVGPTRGIDTEHANLDEHRESYTASGNAGQLEDEGTGFEVMEPDTEDSGRDEVMSQLGPVPTPAHNKLGSGSQLGETNGDVGELSQLDGDNNDNAGACPGIRKRGGGGPKSESLFFFFFLAFQFLGGGAQAPGPPPPPWTRACNGNTDPFRSTNAFPNVRQFGAGNNIFRNIGIYKGGISGFGNMGQFGGDNNELRNLGQFGGCNNEFEKWVILVEIIMNLEIWGSLVEVIIILEK